MPNHVHLVLGTPRGNLSRFMQRLQTAYTVYYNRRHRRAGHLFQGRFASSLVAEDKYILKLSRYVHLNPVYIKSAKRLPVKERLGILRGYPWSSYRSYIGRTRRLAYVEYAPILAMLKVTKAAQNTTYRRFIESGIDNIDAAFIEAKSRSRLCIGSEHFRDKARRMYQRLQETDRKSEDISFRRMGQRLPPERILKVVAKEMAVPLDQLPRRCRGCIARPIAARMLCVYGSLTQRQVAKNLSLTSGAAVSMQLSSLNKMMLSDKKLRKSVNKIEMILRRI